MRKTIFKLFLTASSVGLVAACSVKFEDRYGEHAPMFSIGTTEYQGQYRPDSNTDSFLGIPFAEPPIGDLRWMPPQAAKHAEGEFKADRFATACMQGPHLYNWYRNVIQSFAGNIADFSQPTYSEDCLYLNIWRPHKSSLDDKASLPVLVFIHGGSNKGGWSYEPNYIGENLAARGAVVITIAYRLGVFGFFSHPGLEHANFGLLDQINALSWINQHVSKLGGDPDNVTVFGESSGASNISYLLTSPLASGLFKRAIHQSAGWAIRGTKQKQANEKLGLSLIDVHFPENDDAGIDALRTVPAEEILLSAGSVYADHFFDPVIDGKSVTAHLAESMRTSKLNADDLIIGSNANEALMYVDRTLTPRAWLEKNTPEIDPEHAINLFDSQVSDLQKLDQLATARGYTCPSLLLATLFSEHTNKRSWVYFFTQQREGPRAAQMGAYHGAELPYIFNTHDKWLPTNSDDLAVGESMMDYWIQFAREGDPNSERQPTWPDFTNNSKMALEFNTQLKAGLHPSLTICRALADQAE